MYAYNDREGAYMHANDARPIMVGTDDFNKIRDSGGYYVDKTALIDDIIRSESEVYLFTRPRRFGKSLNLSMIDSYFNIEYAGCSDRFMGLRISELRPKDPDKNSYPVVHFSMKDLSSSDYEGYLEAVRQKVSILYKSFRMLETSDLQNPDDVRLFHRAVSCESTEVELKFSLFNLTRMLEAEYRRPVIVLIDEYDNAVNEASSERQRKEILGFMSIFLSAALKSNKSLKFAVLTGVMQIAKANIFSGLNNLYSDSVFDTGFQEYWGFTEDEVKILCTEYGRPEKFHEAKDWYDGYRFGTVDVYNPWSVLNYVKRGFVPKEYWAESSSNSILNRLYRNVNIGNFEQILELLDGRSFETSLKTSMTYDVVSDDDRSMYSLMAVTGYLKAVHVSGKVFELSFPNREVKTIMADTVDEMMLPTNDAEFGRFCTAVIEGRTDEMESILGRILVQGSYWNLTDERSYELILMTVLFSIASQYRIRTEQEGGNGRIDIIMEPRANRRAGIIIELKKVDSEAELERAADEAIVQIHDRKYYLGMKGTVLLYGISFCGKIPCMKHERLELC